MPTAAELIARVRAEGVAKYQADMRKVDSATRHAGANMASAGRTATAVLALGFAAAATAAAAAGAAILGVGAAAAKFSIDSALEFDTARRKLMAFTGSAQEADRAMQFITDLAAPSLFESRDLAKAATLLSAYGLNIQRVLPLAEQLASAMGEGGESVSEVARVFGRLKSGDFGEAFERLRDFGISFDDLRAKGLQFSKSNEFLGTKLEALAAVSSIVEERFGRISNIMQDSPAAKMASAMDNLTRAGVQAGNVFLTALTPPVEKFSTLMVFLEKEGVFANIARGISSIGEQVGRAFGQDASRGVFVFIAALEELPAIASNVFKALSAMADRFFNLFNRIGDFNGIIAGVEAVTGMKLPRIPTFSQQAGFLANAAIGGSDKLFGTNFAETGGRIGARAVALSRMFANYRPQAAGVDLASTRNLPFTLSGNDEALNVGSQVLDATQQTARHTARTAAATERMLDINRHALGGGALGSMGVTPVEFSSFRNSRGQTITIKVDKSGAKTLDDLIADGAQHVVTQLVRSGQLMTNPTR